MANLGSKKPFLFKKVFIYKNGKFIKEIESVKGAAKWLKIRTCGKIAIAKYLIKGYETRFTKK
jgi:hypothetical protein